jgi:NAD(P)-dependent dehydrogenase (short-subunit alcohol dehydrogenase family)
MSVLPYDEGSQKNYLVTGANQGLGLEAVRQLALLPQTRQVYLACRSESKALAAMEKLVNENDGIHAENNTLVFVSFDASDSKESIARKISEGIPQDERLDGLLFNAGGMGHDTSGKPAGPNKVLDMYQINIIGHIHLLEALETQAQCQDATIVLSGSEVARGVPSMGSPAPKLPTTKTEYVALLQGTTVRRFDGAREYNHVKAMTALYWAAWARRNPSVHVLTVSPGMTRGTSLGKQKSMPGIARAVFPLLMAVTKAFGASHSIEVGAKRYVDAIHRQGPFEGMPSGSFAASAKKGTSGPISNEQGPVFMDTQVQDAVFDAILAVA